MSKKTKKRSTRRPSAARENKKHVLMLQRTVREQVKAGKCPSALATMQHLAQLPGGAKRVSKLKGTFISHCLSPKKMKGKRLGPVGPMTRHGPNSGPARIHRFERDFEPSGMRAVMPPRDYERDAVSARYAGGYPAPYVPPTPRPGRYDRPRGMNGFISPYAIE